MINEFMANDKNVLATCLTSIKINVADVLITQRITLGDLTVDQEDGVTVGS